MCSVVRVYGQAERGAEKQRARDQSLFFWEGLTQKDCPLPSLELVTHKTHKCCQTGAYCTLNKGGHIPDVFPHEVTSCSTGRMGCWEFSGDLLRRTVPPPEVLSALFMFFSCSISSPLSSLFSSFYPSVPPSLTFCAPPSGNMNLNLLYCDT